MKKGIRRFTNYEELSSACADYIQSLSEATLARKQHFSIAFSGGKTPKQMLEYLADKEIQWSKTHIFLADERCVSLSDSLSNFLLIKESLLSKIQIPQENTHPINPDLSSPEQTAQDYEETIRAFFKTGNLPVFDLIVLGLGEDGHTASLFPEDATIGKHSEWVRAIKTPQVAPHVPRITLSMAVISNAAHIVFLISGKSKAPKVKEVIYQKNSTLPAALVRPENGTLMFYLDEDAWGQIATIDNSLTNRYQSS